MTEMSDRRARRARWWGLAWFALGVALTLAYGPLVNGMWLTGLWVGAVYAVLGLMLLLSFLRLPPRTALAYTTLTLVGAIVLVLAQPRLGNWGEPPYLAWRTAYHWPRYEAVVAEVLQGTLSTDPHARWTERRGVDFMVDSGPPVRVAFLQPGGLLDNWEGIVYDPTGRVATAVGWREGSPGEFTAAADVKKLFGGDLVRCVPIEHAYFRCWFT
jgi:hypothetical protein